MTEIYCEDEKIFFGGTAIMTNISNINSNNRGLGVQSRIQGRATIDFGQNDIISAIIKQKNATGTVLELSDGQMLNVKGGAVAGQEGDSVFFELAENNSLRQIFPNVDGHDFFTKKASLSNLEELMKQKGYINISDSKMDIKSDMHARIEERARANEAAGRIARNIGRVSGFLHSAAVGELAAQGIDINKLPVQTLSGVVSELETAKAHTEKMVHDELAQKIDQLGSIGNGQISQMLSHEAPLTIDNIYTYKHSGTKPNETKLSNEDLKNLQGAIDRFFEENGLEKTPENMARVQMLLDGDVPLTKENLDKLVFLQDVKGNADLNALLPYAVELDTAGEGIGNLNIYEPENTQKTQADHLKEVIYKYEARLAMTYEATGTLLQNDIDVDLTPQVQALNTLKEQQVELLKALNEIKLDTEAATQKMADAYKALYTLPYTSAYTVAAIAQGNLAPSLLNLENHIATQKYDENATMIRLKYGDTKAKIADQFAPLLQSMGEPTDEHTLRAAKILTANGMDVNPINLARIKDIDAKITDIQNGLHPRIAVKMIAEGLEPATMQIDDILAFINQFKEEYGTSDREQLIKHIVDMDKKNDILPQVRQQMMEIYQSLHKIMRHDGAGIGFAVNAGIELTLQGITDFAKNYDTSRGRNNTINYSAADGVYFAKHMVTEFAMAATPAPLAEFVQKESMREPLPESVQKIKQLAKNEPELDLESVKNAVKELTNTGREPMRALMALGLPVTVANLRNLQSIREKKLEDNLRKLDTDGILSDALPKADFGESLNPAKVNEEMAEKIEQMLEQAINADDTDQIKKIDQMEIVLQNLNFKKQMLENGRDFDFAMNFNGRVTDVKLHLISAEMSVQEGVMTYINLSTAMGDVEGLLNVKNDQVHLTLSASPASLKFLEENKEMLPEGFVVEFKEKNALQKQLSL